jgi:beta-1,4-mannosyltransferase
MVSAWSIENVLDAIGVPNWDSFFYFFFFSFSFHVISGSADLGVSLHTSTSGVDLPMKVVDMFGCALPVCAYKYPTLSELVVAKSNGLVFENAGELKSQFAQLFKNFPLDKPETQAQLEGMRHVLRNSFQLTRWSENWNEMLLPLLRNLDKTWADSQMFAERPVEPVYTLDPRDAAAPLEDDLEDDDQLLDE